MDEVRVERRGFRCSDPRSAERLERIGTEFLGGFHAALEEHSIVALGLRLNGSTSAGYRGFAFEGAAMALTLLDRLHLTTNSFAEFLHGPGEPHTYMLYVGAGWAFARLPWLRRNGAAAAERYDPLMRWLALDGFGFHEGYFHGTKSAPRLSGYAQRAFDQGMGRSLWFVEGIEPDRVAATIAGFSEARRADLWSGVGLACSYAGGAGFDAVCHLRELAGAHSPALAQGAAFAAEARRRAGNSTVEGDIACRALCGMSALDAAAIAREEMAGLPPDGETPAYEVWRGRIWNRMALAAGRRPRALAGGAV